MSVGRAHRVEVPPAVRAAYGMTESDYASMFALDIHEAGEFPAEHWARATFEGAPAAVARLLRAAWVGALWLRLGAASSPRHILGWQIVQREPHAVVLEARSRLIDARNIILVSGTGVLWGTFVQFNQPIARPVWAAATPVHHQVIPYLLNRAGRSLTSAQ